MQRVIYSDAAAAGDDAARQAAAGAAAGDRELVARCQAGEMSAFNELVLRHQQRAFNIAWQLLRNHEDAAEVAQDAFVKIYQHIGEFRGDSEFTTWMHQIVINLARNKHRWWKRRGRQATVSLDTAPDPGNGPLRPQVAAAVDPPDAAAANAEFLQRLNDQMGRLPARFREVLVLRNVENLSYDQIARAIGCSVGTVKSRIARARDALREAMAEDLS
jgi:RNA polymerase sigma-70 factor (ECF subfamily)